MKYSQHSQFPLELPTQAKTGKQMIANLPWMSDQTLPLAYLFFAALGRIVANPYSLVMASRPGLAWPSDSFHSPPIAFIVHTYDAMLPTS
jgi:hypothetical protein